jgi:hypothetical protein
MDDEPDAKWLLTSWLPAEDVLLAPGETSPSLLLNSDGAGVQGGVSMLGMG